MSYIRTQYQSDGSPVGRISRVNYATRLALDLDINAATATLDLAAVGTPGTYNNVTVDAYGRVTSAATLAYLLANETITLSGDASGSGATAITVTLANSGVTTGTYAGLTVDAKGRVTAATAQTTLAGYGITDAYTKTQVNAALAGKVDNSALGANSGVATLDAGGKLTAAQVPAIALTETHVVGSQAAMLALSAEIGDVAVRTDQSKSYILAAADPTALASWQELLSPSGGGTLVFSGDATGTGTTAITLTLADSGVPAGTYKSVTVDAKGRVTAGSNPTTLADYGIADAYTQTESDARYLQLAGGTVTGNILANTSSINLGSTAKPFGSVYAGTHVSTGNLVFQTPGGVQATIQDIASAVNYITLQGGAAGANVAISGIGASASIGLLMIAKGAGNIALQSNGGVHFVANGATANPINRVNAQGGTAGNPAKVFSTSSGGTPDANVGLSFGTAGTGAFTFSTNGTATLQARINHTASAVNYLALTGGGTGAAPQIAVAGTDPNINLDLSPKGTGGLTVRGNTLTDGSDNLVIGRFNSGSGASSSTFWRGDGAWAATPDQTITLTGDVSGSGTTAITATLATTGVGAGTYKSVTVDAAGRVTAGTNPTTLAGYGITDAQPLDSDLTALANTATTGLYAITGAGSSVTRTLTGTARITVSNGTGVAGNPTIDLATIGTAANYSFVTTDAYGRVSAGSQVSLTGDVTGSVNTTTGAIATTLATVNSNVGTFTTQTVNAKGLVTAAGNLALTGDVTGTASGASLAATLATVNANIGTFTTQTVNAKGLVTAAGNLALTGDVTGTASGASLATTLANSGVTAGSYTNSNITVDAKGRVTSATSGSTSAAVSYMFMAPLLISPNNTDWPSGVLAPAQNDPTQKSLVVRAYDDTAEEGVGFYLNIPAGVTNLALDVRGRAATAPATSKGVVLRLYSRRLANNAAVSAWSAATTLTTITLPANANFQYASQTLTLASLGIVAGDLYMFELTRQGANAADTLVGDFYLAMLAVSFS